MGAEDITKIGWLLSPWLVIILCGQCRGFHVEILQNIYQEFNFYFLTRFQFLTPVIDACIPVMKSAIFTGHLVTLFQNRAEFI